MLQKLVDQTIFLGNLNFRSEMVNVKTLIKQAKVSRAPSGSETSRPHLNRDSTFGSENFLLEKDQFSLEIGRHIGIRGLSVISTMTEFMDSGFS